MNTARRLNVALITGRNDHLIAEMLPRIKEIPEISFEEVIYWKEKRGGIFVFMEWVNRVFIKKIRDFLENIILYPKVEEDLSTITSRLGVRLHQMNDIHSREGVDLIRSLNLDLLIVYGTKALKKPILDLPLFGAINLHQGEIQKYRGETPGFWELWNNEKQVGATVHFINEGGDTCDIVNQKNIPIFEYDTLASVRAKISELSLEILPMAIRQVACSQNQRIPQWVVVAAQRPSPTLYQILNLFLRIKKRHFSLLMFIRDILKKIYFVVGFSVIFSRDLYLHLRGKNILSVLNYHRITNVYQDGMTVGLNAFERQIRFLKKHYYLLSAADLNDLLDGDMRFKRKKCALITFDDGYEDNYTNAMPILEKYSCPAIFFVSTGLIGNDKQFQHDNKYQPQFCFKKMTWEQLQKAMLRCIDVGIHSDTHANLGRISLIEAIGEIESSIGKYREHLKKNPKLMAYPFGGKGDISEEVVSYIKNNQYISILFSAYGNKKNIGTIDRYNIKRIHIGPMDKGLIFWFKVEGGGEL